MKADHHGGVGSTLYYSRAYDLCLPFVAFLDREVISAAYVRGVMFGCAI